MITNPIIDISLSHKKKLIEKSFDFPKNNRTKYNYSFFDYISKKPQKFYSTEAFALCSKILIELNTDKNFDFLSFFSENINNISNAFNILNKINDKDIHLNRVQSENDYKTLLEINNLINPNYLSLVEGVFKPLLLPFAVGSRYKRMVNSTISGLNDIITELSKYSPLKKFLDVYNSVIRNAIAHNSVVFGMNTITFIDRTNQITLEIYELYSLFDSAMDFCNALALAYKMFIYSHENYPMPFCCAIDELSSLSSNSIFLISGCIPQVIHNNIKQICIYIAPQTSNYSLVLYNLYYLVSAAKDLLPEMDRVFFNIHSKITFPGWIAFSIKDIQNSSNINELSKSQETLSFIRFQKHIPKVIKKLHTFFIIFKEIVKYSFHKAPKLILLHSNGHVSKRRLILQGNVFLSPTEEITLSEKQLNQITNIVKKGYIKQSLRNKRFCLLPLGYSQINIFSKELRARSTEDFENYKYRIAIIRLNSNHIKIQDIPDMKKEIIGKYEVFWNPNYI